MNRSFFILSLLLTAQAFFAFGQTPHAINYGWNGIKQTQHTENAICNNAGTFKLGQKIAKSNDIELDTMYLCPNDSVFLDHNGDYDLSGDPIPGTPAGIVYGFYKCKPTLSGDNLTAILGDPCVWLANGNQLQVASGQPNGDIWLYNDGVLLPSVLNDGRPVLVNLAPMTIDYFATLSYESASPGFPPGPCVNVNAAKAVSVVYLTPINETGVPLNNGDNDCLVRFIPTRRLPQFLPSATYQVDISLDGDPAVKGLLLTPQKQVKHGARLVFSAPKPGKYNISLKDGKSCDYHFSINVPGCDPSDNVVFTFPVTNTPVGSTLCVPLKVKNFSALSASFSVQWDPKVLKYKEIKQVHPAIQPAFDPTASVNIDDVGQGSLGVLLLSTSSSNVLTVPDNETLFEICFESVGADGSCSPLVVNNSVTLINVERVEGPLAPTVVAGRVCVGTPMATKEASPVEYALLSPNPVKSGQLASLLVKSRQKTAAQLWVMDATGRTFSRRAIELTPGENQLFLETRTLPAGVYQVMLQTEKSAQSWRLVVATGIN